MQGIKEYFLCICAAALICCVITSLIGNKSASSAIIKLLCGIFLTSCVLGPIGILDTSSIAGDLEGLHWQTGLITEDAKDTARETLAQSIKSRTEAYILDKAASMATELCVEVTLSEDDVPIPCGVIVKGAVSPYARLRLEQMIAQDLSISKEAQTWIP